MKFTLPNEITVDITNSNNEVVQKSYSVLPVTLIDSDSAKRIQVLFPPFKKPLNLWTGQEYLSLTSYTPQQVIDKIALALGDNWEENLKKLLN